MKTIKLFYLFAFILLSASVYAQPGNATVSQSGVVLLSADQPLHGAYSMDATVFNFTSETEAIDYFKTINTEAVVFRPVIDNNMVMMYLQLKKHPEWTKENWAAYLSELEVLKNQKSPNEGLTK